MSPTTLPNYIRMCVLPDTPCFDALFRKVNKRYYTIRRSWFIKNQLKNLLPRQPVTHDGRAETIQRKNYIELLYETVPEINLKKI